MAKRRVGYLALVLLAASAGLSVYASTRPASVAPAAVVGGLALDAPLPKAVPADTTLTIGDPTTEQVLKHTGWDRDLPFKVRWAEISGGPAVTEAFHAKVLDVGTGANIPPIHAVWVAKLADLRGKRIAYSPGQVQGEIVIRALRSQGLTPADVKLVELPSTSADVYINALVGGAIDVAPISAGPAAKRYLDQYGPAGGRVIRHAADRDDLITLYVRDETLRDPAKAAALQAYVKAWGRAQQWISDHPDEWAQAYYVEHEGLSKTAAQAAVQSLGKAEFPARWDEAVALQQSSIDIMAQATGKPRFDAATLFDRRFETLAAEGAAQRRPRDPVKLAAR